MHLKTPKRAMMKLAEPVGNVYEMVRIISKRANQLSVEMKQIWTPNCRNLLLIRTTWRRF